MSLVSHLLSRTAPRDARRVFFPTATIFKQFVSTRWWGVMSPSSPLNFADARCLQHRSLSRRHPPLGVPGARGGRAAKCGRSNGSHCII